MIRKIIIFILILLLTVSCVKKRNVKYNDLRVSSILKDGTRCTVTLESSIIIQDGVRIAYESNTHTTIDNCPCDKFSVGDKLILTHDNQTRNKEDY